jgi:hypothetical protein
MLSNVEMHDFPPVMVADEEAVESTKCDRRHGEEIHCGSRFTVISQKSQRFNGSGCVGARLIQRETVLSETSKLSIRSSP